jgi:hypothetical protein
VSDRTTEGRLRWLHRLRRGSEVAPLLELWVRIPSGAWMSIVSVFCQVGVSAMGRSFVQRSPIECGVPVIPNHQQRGGLGQLGLSSHEKNNNHTREISIDS